MAGEARQGSKVTITFASTGFVFKVTSVGETYSRETIRVTEPDDDWEQRLLSDFSNFESVELGGYYDPDQAPPIASAEETMTIAYKPVGGQSAGATVAFTGGVTNFATTGEMDGEMTATMTLTPTQNTSGYVRTAGT